MRDSLINSAEMIQSPSEQTADALDRVVELCAAGLTAAMLKMPDLDLLIGSANVELMENNHLNQLKYMVTIARLFDAVSFVETVVWVFRTYRAKGFQVAYWQFMLPEAKVILEKNLESEAYAEIEVVYDWLIDNTLNLKALSENEASFYEELGFRA